MNICFIANFYKTHFFHEVAQQLERSGVHVYWVVVNKKLRDFLLGHYPAERILYLSKQNVGIPAEVVGDYRLNELVYGDRVLKYDVANGISFLSHIQRPFYDFIHRYSVSHVFGEVTWAHEILFLRILSQRTELQSVYLCPHTIRIPGGRFAFFKDEFQSEFYESTGPRDEADVSLNFAVKKPDYLLLNDVKLHKSRTLKERLARVRRFINRENIDPDDPCVIASRWNSFKKHASEELNREVYRLVKRTVLTPELQGRPYVFIALHKQPEASIDVIGRYYEDQLMNILNVWRALPQGWFVYVKEHTNAIGDRSYGFYKKLQALSNVVLLDEKADSHQLILSAQAVVTVSGTVAYEAALLGKRSFTFGPCFFNIFENCSRVTLDDLRNDRLFQDAPASVQDGDAAARQYVIDHSWPGAISDPVSNPRCMDESNISMVSSAFLRVITVPHG